MIDIKKIVDESTAQILEDFEKMPESARSNPTAVALNLGMQFAAKCLMSYHLELQAELKRQGIET